MCIRDRAKDKNKRQYLLKEVTAQKGSCANHKTRMIAYIRQVSQYLFQFDKEAYFISQYVEGALLDLFQSEIT